MNPTNSSLNKDTCVNLSSNCVVWEGPDIECLEICTGDSVSDVVNKLGVAYCEFKDSIDLTDFDLKCLFEACQACPEPDKSFINVLSLLRDKICSLEEAIDNIGTPTTPDPEPFSVNLKCLAVTDGNGNILNGDSPDAQVQAIIDQTCTSADDIDLIQNEQEDHEDRITALENDTDDGVPDVTSDCVFIGSKPVDQAYELLDADYCSLKSAIGAPSAILGAIGQQCDLPALLGNPNFVLNPTNAAESLNNVWLALCNALSRLTLIEENCCAPTCDDIKIGFSTTFNEDSTVTLGFNAGTGTTIPNGWTDCGSILTITDGLGNSTTIALTIVNNYTSPDIDLTAFSKGATLTFSLDLKMCADSITCQKCISKTVQYSSSACCSITNVSEDDITIVYTVPVNDTSHPS